jgi:hypothetical protein
MAVIPQSLGRYGGFAGTTGFQLQDTEQQNIAAQGKVQENLLRMQLDAKQREDGANNDLARRNQDLGVLTNNIGADTTRRGQDLNFQLGMAPLDFAKQKFNTLLPMLQSQIGSTGAGLVGGAEHAAAGRHPRRRLHPRPDSATGERLEVPSVDQQTATSPARERDETGRAGLQPEVAAPRRPEPAGGERRDGVGGRPGAADPDGGGPDRTPSRRSPGRTLAEAQWKDFNDADIRRRQAAQQGQNSILSILASLA